MCMWLLNLPQPLAELGIFFSNEIQAFQGNFWEPKETVCLSECEFEWAIFSPILLGHVETASRESQC